MHPVLLEIGELRFHAYTFFLALGVLVSTLLAARDGARLPNPVYVPTQGAVFALIGALIGTRAWWILQYDHPANLYRAIFFWEGSYVYFGGLLGGIAGAVAYLYATRNMDWRIADVVAPYLALGQAFGRVGCFLNGCCYGSVCEYPWAVTFPEGSHVHRHQINVGIIPPDAAQPLPVHPTQLYSIAGLLLICFLLRRNLFKGSPFTFAIALQYLFLYGILRFTVEAFRGDSPRPLWEMTLSQWVSLGCVVGAAAIYAGLEYRSRRVAETPSNPGN